MPTTRKKVIKTVYKNEDSEDETGDFSDSGSEAHISDPASSEDEEVEENISSEEESHTKEVKSRKNQPFKAKPKFAKEFYKKINKQIEAETEENNEDSTQFSVKDLTDADKLLPSTLNLSESDSSDDDLPRAPKPKTPAIPYTIPEEINNELSEDESKVQYIDIWSSNIQDNSAEIAKKTFMELNNHITSIEEAKASLESYVPSTSTGKIQESNVTDLLALGEKQAKKSPVLKNKKGKKNKDQSDSDVEDWEEVKESKAIPQQGLQLFVELPDCVRKSKKVDVEMMMKRKINRVKKEHQVFVHKVHVLCWLGHGNYVSPILNDQEIMAAVLAMVPKGCYPDTRLNMKYIEQITDWYKDKLTLKPNKNENKFRPKAPSLKNILLEQIRIRVVPAKKYMVFIFVAMLRALGLQCRIMFNFITVPLKPPTSELCSLSTKSKDVKATKSNKDSSTNEKMENACKAPVKPKPSTSSCKSRAKAKLPQLDGIYDTLTSSGSEFEYGINSDTEDLSGFSNISQLDGNDDTQVKKSRPVRSTRAKKEAEKTDTKDEEEHASPPKKSKKDFSEDKLIPKLDPDKKAKTRKSPVRKTMTKNEQLEKSDIRNISTSSVTKSPKHLSLKKSVSDNKNDNIVDEKIISPRKTRSNDTKTETLNKTKTRTGSKNKNILSENHEVPLIMVINEKNEQTTPSKYFATPDKRVTRKRSKSNTTVVHSNKQTEDARKIKSRTKSASNTEEKSKYFDDSELKLKKPKLSLTELKKLEKLEDAQRISHKNLVKPKAKAKCDVTGDLVNIIKNRIRSAKEDSKKGTVKGKIKQESDDDSDYLPVEDAKHHQSESDEDFKPTKFSPKGPKVSPGSKPSTSKKKLDRRVLSSDDSNEGDLKKVDVWCEIFVEELEQWVAVDVIKGKVHCASELYSHATHPVCYVVGWDNNNYLKDLTRRYVPHWNTVTRKQRVEPEWWRTAVQPWLGPRSARDREEDDALDRMQLEAPLPKSIAEYKNHPLYALKRHLLKFEAIYPPDAQTLGFVRNEPVYARECVYVCRSRDTWLKEAKVVKMGEKPYKVVKARPKWDKLSNKLITDKPLEVFGPWQVQDYEPPTAENGVVPRNAYGNVELFKDCMLPKGTVHIKLPGLNKVARKLNIDCAPAMTGFDFNGGWSHPVYDGFVVCKEFEEIVTEAWIKDQEEQERREREKIELRVYGNWKRLIKGLLIRERLKYKYGFEEPAKTQPAKSKKGPRFVAKKH